MKVKFGFLDTSGTGRYGGQIGEAKIVEWNKINVYRIKNST